MRIRLQNELHGMCVNITPTFLSINLRYSASTTDTELEKVNSNPGDHAATGDLFKYWA